MTSTGHRHGPWLKVGETRIEMPTRGQCALLEVANPTVTVAWDQPNNARGLILFRGTSGVSGIIPVDITVLRNGVPVTSISVLHHGDKLNIAGINGQYMELEKIEVDATTYLMKRLCPYCKSTFALGDYSVACPLCGEGYHDNCWSELDGGQCCSRNCSFSPGPVKPVAATDAPT